MFQRLGPAVFSLRRRNDPKKWMAKPYDFLFCNLSQKQLEIFPADGRHGIATIAFLASLGMFTRLDSLGTASMNRGFYGDADLFVG
jgi:hypothetical protein